MIERRFREVWRHLQGRKPHMPHFLNEVYLDGIRGIEKLRVLFEYPVSVVAGGNATGKSTVLFAAACAYRVPGAGVRDYVPSTLFPDFRPKVGGRRDRREVVILRFDYSTPDGRRSMQWRRSKGWNRSFMGRKRAKQPERPLYLRTLSNLSNPSDVRSVLSMSRAAVAPQETPLTAAQVSFAQQVLPFRYSEVVDLASGRKNLLFAARKSGAEYSELHMAAGERAILRLSKEIAQLDGAVVLIDGIEAGLHPWVQQLLMLHLQQLALRRDLQIVVTSHSPVVLDSVPSHARIFLDRDASGVLDSLVPRCMIRREAVRIGRDTGADEFPAHAAAFRKFGQIGKFVFVLDGDARDRGIGGKIRRLAEMDVPVLYLPGSGAPEAWIWEMLPGCAEAAAPGLGTNPGELAQEMARIDSLYASVGDTPSEIAKAKLQDLSWWLEREPSDVCRLVGRLEADRGGSDIQPLVGELEGVLLAWRSG